MPAAETERRLLDTTLKGDAGQRIVRAEVAGAYPDEQCRVGVDGIPGLFAHAVYRYAAGL